MSEIKLGERIRTVRKKAKCTQKEFSSLLNIPQSTLSAYETDRMQPTVASLINIAEKFGVSLNWLCGVEGGNEIIMVMEQDSNGSDSELSDDLKAALDDATEFLQELAARRQIDEKLRKKIHKNGVTASEIQ